nr:protein NOI4-like isoform X1 [Coffea arabica]
MSQEKGRPLPKFGEWDVNNPASADGFTVIFAKARDEKKATGTAAGGNKGQNLDHASRPAEPTDQQSPTTTKKWFCCF